MYINSCDDMPFSFSGCDPDYSGLHQHTTENRIMYLHPMTVAEESGIMITTKKENISIDDHEYQIITWTTEGDSIWDDGEEE